MQSNLLLFAPYFWHVIFLSHWSFFRVWLQAPAFLHCFSYWCLPRLFDIILLFCEVFTAIKHSRVRCCWKLFLVLTQVRRFSVYTFLLTWRFRLHADISSFFCHLQTSLSKYFIGTWAQLHDLFWATEFFPHNWIPAQLVSFWGFLFHQPSFLGVSIDHFWVLRSTFSFFQSVHLSQFFLFWYFLDHLRFLIVFFWAIRFLCFDSQLSFSIIRFLSHNFWFFTHTFSLNIRLSPPSS